MKAEVSPLPKSYPKIYVTPLWQGLVYHERDVVNTLRKYITEESERLEEIKKHVEEYRLHNQEVKILTDLHESICNSG